MLIMWYYNYRSINSCTSNLDSFFYGLMTKVLSNPKVLECQLNYELANNVTKEKNLLTQNL